MKYSLFEAGLRAAGCRVNTKGKTKVVFHHPTERKSASYDHRHHKIAEADARDICKQLGIDPSRVGCRSCR